MRTLKWIIPITIAGVTSVATADNNFDFGKFSERDKSSSSMRMFGVRHGLDSSSLESITADQAEANPLALITLADGLHGSVVSAAPELGANIDMMALWPNGNHPTHIIACNEQGVTDPGVQRISLATGAVETILTGTTSCDPTHVTPWGTILVGEESGSSGQLIEIFDPMHTTDVIYDRNTGVASSGAGAANVVQRLAPGRTSFEGVAILSNGVMYYGDENRPSEGTAGGAYFKFVPSTPYAGGAPITDPTASPLAAGTVYGLRLGKRSGNTDYGQGTQTGLGVWVEIPGGPNANLRAAAATLKLTGYYRPEDLAVDLAAQAAGNVRACGNNTGNEEDDMNFGETICLTDGTLAEATAGTSTPMVQFLVIGNPEFAMMDNIAYQPGRGNWVIQEDGDGPSVYGRNNDVWDCVDDGADDDLLSDGCIRIATLNDLNAESTGGLFDARGRRYYLSVQHNVTGHGVIVRIDGFR